LKGNPRGTAGALIRWANAQDAPILALDAPSGVDTATGVVFDPAIKAAATMTLAASVRRRSLCGRTVPGRYQRAPGLYAEPALALQVGPIFAAGDIVRLR